MPASESGPPRPAAVRERIDERAAAVRERELSRALAAFEDAGETTATQRAVLTAFAHRLTADLLAPVEESLAREAAADADACRRLFLRERPPDDVRDQP
ncbi:MAG: hypothetical protein ABEJ06_01740 [Haloarculaceae archaeon]